jgi:hypothetical protein
MAPYGHDCDPLCDQCLEEHRVHLSGVAQCRGEAWARAIARVIPIDSPWPVTEKMRAIAVRKVSDLTGDLRLREVLADDCVTGAARWWNRALERAG